MRRFPAIVAAALLAGGAPGCGDETPEGRGLASPAEREAAPAPAPGAEPAPEDEPAEPGDPAPRMGAPAAIGDAPERPGPAPVPSEEPDGETGRPR
jgi:hypothetical protein